MSSYLSMFENAIYHEREGMATRYFSYKENTKKNVPNFVKSTTIVKMEDTSPPRCPESILVCQ